LRLIPILLFFIF